MYVGQVDRIHKTTILPCFFPPFRPKMFWGYVDQKLKKGLNRYLGSWKFKSKYLDISNCVFTMNTSTKRKIAFQSFIEQDFIYMGEKYHLSQAIHVFRINILYFGLIKCKYYFLLKYALSHQYKKNNIWWTNKWNLAIFLL